MNEGLGCWLQKPACDDRRGWTCRLASLKFSWPARLPCIDLFCGGVCMFAPIRADACGLLRGPPPEILVCGEGFPRPRDGGPPAASREDRGATSARREGCYVGGEQR